MKKDLEWTKKQMKEIIDGRMTENEMFDRGYQNGITNSLDILNQLDEPETVEQTTRLLESVLKENKRLGKLLEEKHEEWLELMDEINNQEKLSKEWIDDNKSLINGRSINPDGTEGECYDAHYIHVLELQNLLVPKQELPVIPKFVAEWIEFKKKSGISYENVFQAMDELVKSRTLKAHDWALKTNENKDTFARAWLDGYTVEEEQKYVIKLDDESYLQRYEIDNKNIVTPFRIVGHLKEVAIKFDNKERAEKVAELVEGKVEELEE